MTTSPARLVRRVTILGVLPLFAAWYLWQATTIHLPRRELVVSPREFPTFIGVLLLVVTLALAVQELRKPRDEPATDAPAEDEGERISSWRDVWVVVAGLVAYVVLFGPLGYVLTTIGLLTGLSTYFAKPRWRRNVVVSLLFTLLTWYVFRSLLSVQLPTGVLPLGF